MINKHKFDILLSKPIVEMDPWTFNHAVAAVFPDMMKRSVPGYRYLLSMIGRLANRYVENSTQVYDLGCSTGAVTIEIEKNIHGRGCKIIAVDNSEAMIQCCRIDTQTFCSTETKIEIIEDDLQNIEIYNASLVVLNFTLQFYPREARQNLLNAIWSGLNPYGMLVLSEKFSFSDIKIDHILSDMHYDFKRMNGYSDLEIYQKRCMLDQVMLTESLSTHIQRLKSAGFQHNTLWFQYFNFGSILALKPGPP
ncbi:carboxy-S-adenosyl-L-methionine synthase CmoA [Candidatus Erwinia haradaeae]|uniref:Carboxy-S-adenosyl-L-methionine synthase n=1 Tax=Candidatus Erwinia haradaeae TaxID=1922217 RepID=A0A451D4I2_9GAMM|nr:carboxy-S-adenosyl-L-methionine synthase CmoA [Candidatus Erwinia haradaeae]VFP80601.1 Carboxy-S-adenosyl-L-methionine synthase [Candidatus Erwinia haradaeae]